MMTASLYTKLKVRYVLSETANLFKYIYIYSNKHLEALEAAFINALKPDLCQQKVFGKLVSV